MPKPPKGLKFVPHFVKPKDDPYKSVRWTRRDCEILDVDGGVVFRRQGVEAPESWSRLAVDIAASKYFRRRPAETSVQDLVDRVVGTIASQGRKLGYFRSRRETKQFESELAYLCLNQFAAFNSPVWFNCGIFHKYGIRGTGHLWKYSPRRKKSLPLRNAYVNPQTSACFILSVDDELSSIFELAKTEAMIFKFGSGSGTNFSRLRGKNEPLENGGRSSGVIAFLEVLDRGAGATKSGGTTRRAAKMVTLNVDHPEIMEFIHWKSHEEKKARDLVKAGYSGGLDGEAYRTVSGQNSNNSVRVSDRFMKAVERNGDWRTKLRTSGKPAAKLRAADVWRELALAAWECADPGVQYHDNINKWHTCPRSGAIEASNPCSEYMFLNDSACNLASLNLAKFLRADRTFDVDAFESAVRTMFIAQEILIGFSAYPTAEVAENSYRFRPLGLGFANLGGLLLRLGLPYDSDEARSLAAWITAVMTGAAYRTSAELARSHGPFAAFKANRGEMLAVIKRHAGALRKIPDARGRRWPEMKSQLESRAKSLWRETIVLGAKYGFRNSQATLLAPTGTISLLMDCETTGIEPDFAPVKTKSLVGGGAVRMVNRAVPIVLKDLGYPEATRERLLRHLELHGTFEGQSEMEPGHLKIFDCAQSPRPGGRRLSPEAHLRMMAAVQPFLSGAISKTISLPAEAKPRDVQNIYLKAWRLGLKAVAVYRDGAKAAQPLNSSAAPGNAPPCGSCGFPTVRSGSCFKCLNCGHSESCG